MAWNEADLPSLDVRENGEGGPFMFDDDATYSGDAGMFEQLCGSILSLLRGYHLIYALNNESKLKELILKLDNIRLRFVIWLKINHGTTCENYEAVMEILTHLDIFLLSETETILKGRAHGLKHYREAVEDSKFEPDQAVLSPLHRCFQHQVDMYLIQHDIAGFMRSVYYAWIVVDYTDCLSFLATIDTLLEDLFSNTSNHLSSTLIHDYAYSAMETIPNEQLTAILFSGFSDNNAICQAAEEICTSRESGNDVLVGHASVATSEDAAVEEWLLEARADAESLADSSSPIFTPTTSEAPLDVQERFALIADRAKESRDLATKQAYPASQLTERRILAELGRSESASPFATVACIDGSISNLLGIVSGPPGTPYENGIFFIKIKISEGYPLVPADISFVSKIYHLNINSTGQVCAVTKDRYWGVGCSVWGILTSIYSLLAAPNTNGALAPAMKREYMENRKAFEATAKEWTERFANQDWPSPDELSSHVYLAPPKTRVEKGRKPSSGGAGK